MKKLTVIMVLILVLVTSISASAESIKNRVWYVIKDNYEGYNYVEEDVIEPQVDTVMYLAYLIGDEYVGKEEDVDSIDGFISVEIHTASYPDGKAWEEVVISLAWEEEDHAYANRFEIHMDSNSKPSKGNLIALSMLGIGEEIFTDEKLDVEKLLNSLGMDKVTFDNTQQ